MSDPIPANIFEEIKRFLEEKQTGSITLHCTGGAVHKAVIERHLKADAGRREGAETP